MGYFSTRDLLSGSFDSYAEAREHFDSVKAWRGRDEKPIGKRAHKTKRMRMLADGTIVYTHHSTDVLWVHPNDRITVRGYCSMTTSQLLNFLLPSGITHNAGGVKCGDGDPVLLLHDRDACPYGRWEEDMSRPPNRWGHRPYKRVPPENPTEVIRCGSPVTLKLDRRTNRWRPIGKIEPFEWRKLGKRARQVTKRLNIAEFKQVVPALVALLPPEERRFNHSDVMEIARLLLERRYAEAFDACELDWHYTGFQSGAGSQYELRGVKQLCLNKVRDHYCVWRGALTTHRARVLTLAQWGTYKANRRRFG